MEIPKHIDSLVERYNPLPNSDQLILVEKAQGGCQVSRDQLILSNLRFILKEIRSLPTIPIRLEFNDLFDAGAQGMLEALNQFDASNNNVNFLTYAYWWIKKRIIQTVYQNLSVMHIPKAQVKQLERLYSLCEKKIQRSMTGNKDIESMPRNALEMAQELFGEEDKAAYMRLQCAWRAFDVSDSYTDNVGSIELSQEDVHQDEIEFLDEFERCMHVLTDREEDIVKRYFGLGCKPQDYEEIGLLYILTPERIRQIAQRALEKIKGAVLPTVASGENVL